MISALEKTKNLEENLTESQNKDAIAIVEGAFKEQDIKIQCDAFIKSLSTEESEIKVEIEEKIKASFSDRFPKPIRNAWMVFKDFLETILPIIGGIFSDLKQAFFNNLPKLRGSSESKNIDTESQVKKGASSIHHQETKVDDPRGIWSNLKTVLHAFRHHKGNESTSKSKPTRSSISPKNSK